MSVSPIFLCWQKSTFKEPKLAGILILHVFELTEKWKFRNFYGDDGKNYTTTQALPNLGDWIMVFLSWPIKSSRVTVWHTA